MNKSDIVLYTMVMFFLTVTSIAVHETVHIIQFSLAGSDIDEIVFLGWKQTDTGNAAGWVKSATTKNFSLGELELQAHFVQIIYVFIMGFLLNLWAAGYRKRERKVKPLYSEF